jgi:predicted dehydrogenase
VLPATVLSSSVRAAHSSKPALAGVGVGGVGFGQLQDLEKAGFEIVALCDVDFAYARKAFDKWPQARRYKDFREMLQTEGDKADAVYCGTPDHTHTIVTLEALRRRKHVCCVKPLTRTVAESSAVLEAVRAAGTKTQMTASPNTGEDGCRITELIQGGAIGPVREVHIWTARPWWPQGMLRPAGEDPVPADLDWKLWLGPAPQRPYKGDWPAGSAPVEQVNAFGGKSPFGNGVYHPFNFRGWWDFGTGALGDMGCHYFNTPFRALGLRYPISVQATGTRVFPESAPLAAMVTYDFPARGEMPPVRVTWYDGGLRPPAPKELAGKPLDEEGILYVGDAGKMLGSQVLPGAKGKDPASIAKTLERRGGTWAEWYEAVTKDTRAGCDFEWSVPLTAMVLLGNIALRTGKHLAWDAQTLRFTNSPEANQLLTPKYENGWKLG